jgi:hypothetical protein
MLITGWLVKMCMRRPLPTKCANFCEPDRVLQRSGLCKKSSMDSLSTIGITKFEACKRASLPLANSWSEVRDINACPYPHRGHSGAVASIHSCKQTPVSLQLPSVVLLSSFHGRGFFSSRSIQSQLTRKCQRTSGGRLDRPHRIPDVNIATFCAVCSESALVDKADLLTAPKDLGAEQEN